MAETPRTRLPNLDGLRAFSVLLVLLFHSQFLGVTGGYIGVSVFFTISGYLLTDRLLSRPIDRHAIVNYWGGRWRRILPAAWTVLAGIVAYEAATGNTPLNPAHRLWAIAGGFGNWFQLHQGTSYAALFQQADMMVHYWSLGIEQQVYLVLPLLLWLTSRLWRGRAQLGTVLLLIVVSFVLPIVAGMSVARTYYGTDTRAGEILVGVALAIVHRQGLLPRAMSLRWGNVLTSATLAGLIAVSLMVGPGDEFVRRGLLPLVALLSTVLIHSAVSTPKVLGGVLGWRVSTFLGDLSYPIYLLHWPIIVILQRHGVPAGLTFLIALVGAIVIGQPIVRFIERPIRRAPGPMRWRVWVGVMVVALTIVGTQLTPPRARQYLAALEADASATDVKPVAGQPRVAVFGDSSAKSLGLLIERQVPSTTINLVGTASKLGCGLITSLESARCKDVPDQWSSFLHAHVVDLAVVMSCQWDVLAHDVPGVGQQIVGQLEIDRAIHDAYTERADQLLAAGVGQVSWVLCPPMSNVTGDQALPEIVASRDPQRVNALNTIIRSVVDEHPGHMHVLDLATWMTGKVDDASIRPDGVHFEYSSASSLSAALPTLLATAIEAAKAAPSTQTDVVPSAKTGRIGTFGDSASLTLALLMIRQIPEQITYAGDASIMGCGLIENSRCPGTFAHWAEVLASHPTDIALVLSCQWELVSYDLPGKKDAHVGTPEMDAVIRDSYRRAAQVLIAGGVQTIVWLTCPEFNNDAVRDVAPDVREGRQPERVAALNTIIRSLPSEFPGWVTNLDLATWMQSRQTDLRLRPDGAHFAYDWPTDLSRDFPALLAEAIAAVDKG